MWCIYTVNYSATKMEILSYVTIWIHLGNMVPTWCHRTNTAYFYLHEVAKVVRLIETGNRVMTAGAGAAVGAGEVLMRMQGVAAQ